MLNQLLTIVIPTHNRYNLLLSTIQSIVDVYNDNVQIIIGDNSTQLDTTICQKITQITKNFMYLDLHRYERNIYKVYSILVSYVATPYTLILEDDDVLINKYCHDYILKILAKYDIITFSSCYYDKNKLIKQLNIANIDLLNNKHNIVQCWNGEFQFSNTYYKTNILKNSIDVWFNYDLTNMFNIFYDEAIALISIYSSNSYIHINQSGLKIGISNDNMSWNNIMFSMYSSYQFVEKLRFLLYETITWEKQYKDIIFRELTTLCSSNKLTYRSVFYNQFFSNIQKHIMQNINMYNVVDMHNYLKNMLLIYNRLYLANE